MAIVMVITEDITMATEEDMHMDMRLEEELAIVTAITGADPHLILPMLTVTEPRECGQPKPAKVQDKVRVADLLPVRPIQDRIMVTDLVQVTVNPRPGLLLGQDRTMCIPIETEMFTEGIIPETGSREVILAHGRTVIAIQIRI